MRILLVHPNHHSPDADLSGNWPPAWAACLAGALRAAGHGDVSFIDAASEGLSEQALCARIAAAAPEVIGVSAMTPSIREAESVLRIARQLNPAMITILGGVHATFMYQQVLAEAPWIDVIVRGEGEEVLVALMDAILAGRWPAARHELAGIAFTEESETGPRIIATPAAPGSTRLDTLRPDWGIMRWEKYRHFALDCRAAVVSMSRGCAFTCAFCSQWKFWRDHRVRDPRKLVDEIADLFRTHDVRFFRLADEEPTLHRRKFIEFCKLLIARDLPRHVQWGINARITDILRDEQFLPLYRKAGLIHVSLGTDSASQLRLDGVGREARAARNRRAITLLRKAGIVVEAQFIVGLQNESAHSIEETFRLTRKWKPDLAIWSMFTPWPFSSPFRELRGSIEILDFSSYDFMTPVLRPRAMDRTELFERVRRGRRRFHLRKLLLSYLWPGRDPRRRYLRACLRARIRAEHAHRPAATSEERAPAMAGTQRHQTTIGYCLKDNAAW